MALFRYEATDRSGKVVRGVMDARDEQQVVSNLSSMGYAARSIQGGTGSQPRAATTSTSRPTTVAARTSGIQAVTVASGIPVSIKSKVAAYQLAMFFRGLVTLVRSGVPLTQSFGDLAPTTRNSRLRTAVSEMHQVIQSGGSLSSAMAAHPNVFPVHAIASVWAGEMAGRLEVVLEEVASDFEREASDTRFGRIGWGLAKGYTLFLVAALPFFNVDALISPAIGMTPEDVEKSRDLLGNYFRGALDAVIHKSIPVIALLIFSWIAWGWIKRIPTVRRLLDEMLVRAPVWGKLHRYRGVERFLHFMDHMSASGIVPSTAWEAACLTPRNSGVAERLKLARTRGSANSSLTELANISKLLDPEEVTLIAAGEKAGQIPAILGKLKKMYEDKARIQQRTARIISIEFLITLVIAIGGTAMIVIAKSYVAPLYKLMGM